MRVSTQSSVCCVSELENNEAVGGWGEAMAEATPDPKSPCADSAHIGIGDEQGKKLKYLQ
jgi:hypothetical protein